LFKTCEKKVTILLTILRDLSLVFVPLLRGMGMKRWSLGKMAIVLSDDIFLSKEKLA
jgi:hypothetical protein